MQNLKVENNELVLTVWSQEDRSVGIFSYPVKLVFPAEWVTKIGPERVELVASMKDFMDTYAGGFSDACFSDQCSDCHTYLVNGECTNKCCSRNTPDDPDDVEEENLTTREDIAGKEHLYKTARIFKTGKFVALIGYDNGGMFLTREEGCIQKVWRNWHELDRYTL
jgi:hypothetical protein